MDNNKRKWSLEQHRAQSPQFDASVKYQNKIWVFGLILSFIIGIFTGLILQVLIFPWLYDPHPNVNITLDDKTDFLSVLVENKSDFQYKLRINTDTPIEDLYLSFLIPGVIKNNEEDKKNTECDYVKFEGGVLIQGEQGVDQNGRGVQRKGQEQISIQCQRMGSDGHYYLYFDLNDVNYTPIILYFPNGAMQIPAFHSVACSYYMRGVNDRIIKNNCNLNITLSDTTMKPFINRGIRLFDTPVNS